eukprot:c6370_g1_i1.p1 GENE.c6370_g1_i1~~c6370_g1_i1.p1  ORF type:complete len:287 (+),score=69.39 c6370_g1_i1:87-863(+)
MMRQSLIAFVTVSLAFFLFSIKQLDDETKQHTAATHLLDEAHGALELFDHERQVWIQDLLRDIHDLSETLKTEELALNSLEAEKELVKKANFFWFLNVADRETVDDLQLRMKIQQRVVDNIADDIDVHWRKLKPLYGLKSKMFVSEAVMSVFRVFADIFVFFVPSLVVSLPTLLLLAPLSAFLVVVSLSIGFLLFPYTVGLIAMIWAMKFPAVLVQYNPSPAQFAVAYASACVVVAAVVGLCFRLFGRPARLAKFHAA